MVPEGKIHLKYIVNLMHLERLIKFESPVEALVETDRLGF